MSKIIDCYTHFASDEMVEYMEEKTGTPMVFRKLFSRIPVLNNVDKRLEMMDKFSMNANCIIPLPWLESSPQIHNNPIWAGEAARINNEHFARIKEENRGRFYMAALIPTTNEEVMMQEANYALKYLQMDGIALFCGPTVKPLDDPQFEPLWQLAEELKKPVWLHPCRPQFVPDYDAYKDKGSQFQIWNTLGWIYDTSVAMVHIAQAGIFQRYPKIKIVSHHHGGMIPFFTERFETQAANFDDDCTFIKDLRKFYCDTATFGETPLNIRQAIDFFGIDRVMFGTDTPMDMSAPGSFMKTGMSCIQKLNLSKENKEKILFKNCASLLNQSPDKIYGQDTELIRSRL
mmetsp:Transcript_33622/g.42916  ORF Transcript_33622/g.42916 Transcript_33622/m.42916 type:complete len:345 (+) Transcript_33622:96-1130(+)